MNQTLDQRLTALENEIFTIKSFILTRNHIVPSQDNINSYYEYAKENDQ
jgi:hypothetical protein